MVQPVKNIIKKIGIMETFDIPFEVEEFGTATVNNSVEFPVEEPIDSPLLDEISDEFIGSWNFLISRTNWDKGELIHAWRTKLATAGLPHQTYTDEVWSRRVGNVSPQHVGRLRRVFERFGETREKFPKLYWSHFQASLDWEDAEMWLEGAVQNQWSVATMRIQRWEATGAPPDKKPRDADIVSGELDEDVNPRNDSDYEIDGQRAAIGTAGKEAGDKDEDFVPKKRNERNDFMSNPDGPTTGELLATLKELKDLPDDLRDAFEQLKIAIISHKLTEWKEVDQKRVLALLDALKAVVISVEED